MDLQPNITLEEYDPNAYTRMILQKIKNVFEEHNYKIQSIKTVGRNEIIVDFVEKLGAWGSYSIDKMYDLGLHVTSFERGSDESIYGSRMWIKTN